MEELRFVTLDEVPRYEAPSSPPFPPSLTVLPRRPVSARCRATGIFLRDPFPPDFEGNSSGGFLPVGYDRLNSIPASNHPVSVLLPRCRVPDPRTVRDLIDCSLDECCL